MPKMKIAPHPLFSVIALSIALAGCDGKVADEENKPPAPPFSRNQAKPEEKSAPRPHLNLDLNYSQKDGRLQAIGIPSPDSSAYFRSLPDATLEAMARAGNKQAITFWVERLADDALTLQRARSANGGLPNGIQETDAVGNIGKAGYYLGALMQDPHNAMAGYLWGLQTASSTYGGPLEPIVAGIRLAGLRGDYRAEDMEHAFRATHPDLNESEIQMYFESGRRQLESAARPRKN